MDDEGTLGGAEPVKTRPGLLLLGAVAMMAGAATLAAASPNHSALEPAAPWTFVLLLAACVVTELCILDFHFRGETQSFSLNEIVLVVGIFFFAPLSLVAAIACGGAIAMVLQRVAPLKFVYNLAQQALGVALAAVVFHAIIGDKYTLTPGVTTRPWLAALAASATALTVATLAIVAAILVFERTVPLRALGRTYALGLAGAGVNTMLGLVCVLMLFHEPVAVVLLVAPVAVVFLAYRAYVSEHSKSEGLRFLYGASQVLNDAKGLEAGLLALLEFSRDTLNAELVEIVVLGEDDPDTAFVTTAGPRDEQTAMAAVPLGGVEALLAPVGEAGHALLFGPKDVDQLPSRPGFELGSAMLAPLAGESGMRGVLIVANAKGNVHTFKKDELRLFETFASHLGVTLEKSQLNSSLAQLRALKNELAHQAYHDSLTGLANRVLFRDRVTAGLENVPASGTGLAVLFIDLDDFKTVNDTMGHAAGDTLLRVIGERITACIGVEDTAARLGGDEFAVLLTNTSNDADVRVVADRILLALGDPVDIDGQPVVAHASIGVATHASAADADALMQNADVAMYTAKRNGKGRCDVFEPALSMSVANRHQVKMGLERAVGTDEFLLHYQPVVNIVTGEIVATEALLRWRDPSRGLLPPAEFIAIAEETGLIVPIGRHVLRDACRQAKEWEPLAPDVRMFVNLSARQLLDPTLLEDVTSALHDANLDPGRLVLEVTETAMMQDIEHAQATLTALKATGVGLGVDDFGTGYSSLSYLRQLPIDVLKIAKPFIDAVDETPEDAEFVRGIVRLGHVVGLHVVAEGVERVEQSARLIEMGCDSAQGYYYARSLEPAAIVALLRRANIERTIKAFAKSPAAEQQSTRTTA